MLPYFAFLFLRIFLNISSIINEIKLFHMGSESVHGDICFLHSSWEKHSTLVTMSLMFYYGNLGLGVYPWGAGHLSEHINNKDIVLSRFLTDAFI